MNPKYSLFAILLNTKGKYDIPKYDLNVYISPGK